MDLNPLPPSRWHRHAALVSPRPRSTRIAGRRARDLRREMTIPEVRVWGAIRRGRVGAKFRRQVPIDTWIVDFACLDPKLVVEIDDPSHDWRDETARTLYLEARGFAVLRFTNDEVTKEFPEVINTIEEWVKLLRADEERGG